MLNPKACVTGVCAAVSSWRGANHRGDGALVVRGLVLVRILLACGGPCPVLCQLPAHGRPQGAPKLSLKPHSMPMFLRHLHTTSSPSLFLVTCAFCPLEGQILASEDRSCLDLRALVALEV